MSLSHTSPSHEANALTSLLFASVQMEPTVGHKAANLARSIHLIEQAAAQGAAAVVLPELANSGYVFSSREEAFSLAEAVPDGESTMAWAQVAQRLNVYVIAGLVERVADKLYNTAVVIGPKGHIGTYRKVHLWGDEHLFFEPGDLGLPVFHTEIGRLAVLICYDGWFPETYRVLALKGADVVCMPTNWVPMPGQPADAMAMANTLVMANAHSNGLSVVCADRIGTERGQPFIGRSLIVGSGGWPLAGPASADREEILYARIDLRHSRQVRHLNAFNNVLKDRRDDVYGAALDLPGPQPRSFL